MSNGGKYVAAVSQCGDGKAKDGLGRRKEEEADDVAVLGISVIQRPGWRICQLDCRKDGFWSKQQRSPPAFGPGEMMIICSLCTAVLRVRDVTL